MAKAYTNLQQGRKLAETLPIESADMSYFYRHWEIDINYAIGDKENLSFSFHKERYEKHKDDSEYYYLPCWSLDALLKLLPEVVTVFDEETTDDEDGERDYTDYKLNIFKENEEWIIFYEEDAHSALDHDWLIDKRGEHLIDAAYNAIVELHNKGLL